MSGLKTQGEEYGDARQAVGKGLKHGGVMVASSEYHRVLHGM